MNIKYLALGVVGLAILAVFAVPAVQYVGGDPHSRIIGSIGNIKQILLALKTYHEDKLSEGSGISYPSSLEELLENNYLSANELKSLRSNMMVDYFPPSSDGSSKNQLLIVSHVPAIRIPGIANIPSYVIYGQAAGSVTSKALK